MLARASIFATSASFRGIERLTPESDARPDHWLGCSVSRSSISITPYDTVFVIDLASRRVQILGSTPHPNDQFMQQIARTLTAAGAFYLRASFY